VGADVRHGVVLRMSGGSQLSPTALGHGKHDLPSGLVQYCSCCVNKRFSAVRALGSGPVMTIVIPVVASRMPPIMTYPKRVPYFSIPFGTSETLSCRLGRK
jgi:hypothetical protein